MNIAFVSPMHLDSNTGLHIHNLANCLVERGHECIVFVPDRKELSQKIGAHKFRTLNFHDADSSADLFSDGQNPDIVHAWTPREVVRLFVETRFTNKEIPLLVHLEDNEECILVSQFGKPIDSLQNATIPPHLSHPVYYKEFLRSADGVTALIDPLLEFKPEESPGLVIWPGYDAIFDRQDSCREKTVARFNIPKNHLITAYTGHSHPSNKREIYSLYLAIHILNRSGTNVTLIRTGGDSVEVIPDQLSSILRQNCIELGRVDRETLSEIVCSSDFLIQPGKSGNFNDYRFPSKLPDYLVSGTPVLLPTTNIGKVLEDNVNCLLLKRGDALEIAQRVSDLLKDIDLRKQIGSNGRKFAISMLNWERAASKTEEFYAHVLAEKHRSHTKAKAK